MQALIFKKAGTAMQSGGAGRSLPGGGDVVGGGMVGGDVAGRGAVGSGGGDVWLLEYPRSTRAAPDAVMGWASSPDTLHTISLAFPSAAAAVAYAESNGIAYMVHGAGDAVGNVSVAGNVSGDVSAAGNVSAVGNVSAAGVGEKQNPRRKRHCYSDNFAPNRREAWTH